MTIQINDSAISTPVADLLQIPLINNIQEMEDFFVTGAGSTMSQFDLTTLVPGIENGVRGLSDMFLSGLNDALGVLINRIKSKIILTCPAALAYLATNPAGIDWNDNALVDTILGSEEIQLTYTQTSGLKKIVKTIKTTYPTIREKFEGFRIAQLEAYSEFSTVQVAQSDFRKKFLKNCINPKNMNTSDRNMYESLGIGAQCDRAYDDLSKIPYVKNYLEDDGTPTERSRSWKEYCYICNADIDNNNSQCEHILPVFHAIGFKCLLQASNLASMDDNLNLLRRLEYAGSHPCCNLIKNDTSFIDLIPTATPPVVVNDDTIDTVLGKIKVAATSGSGNKQGCLDEPHLGVLDIDETRDTMKTNFLDPFVDKLNELFIIKSTGNYARPGVILFYYRYNQLNGYELSVEQTIMNMLSVSDAVKNAAKNIEYVIFSTLKSRLTQVINSVRSLSAGYVSIVQLWTGVTPDDILNAKYEIIRRFITSAQKTGAYTAANTTTLESLLYGRSNYLLKPYIGEFETFDFGVEHFELKEKAAFKKPIIMNKYTFYVTALIELYYSEHKGSAQEGLSNICECEVVYAQELLSQYISLELLYYTCKIATSDFGRDNDVPPEFTTILTPNLTASIANLTGALNTNKDAYDMKFAQFIAVFYTYRLHYLCLIAPECVEVAHPKYPGDIEDVYELIKIHCGTTFYTLFKLLPDAIRNHYTNKMILKLYPVGTVDMAGTPNLPIKIEIDKATYDAEFLLYPIPVGPPTGVQHLSGIFYTYLRSDTNDQDTGFKLSKVLSLSGRLKLLYNNNDLIKTEMELLNKLPYVDELSSVFLGGSIKKGGKSKSVMKGGNREVDILVASKDISQIPKEVIDALYSEDSAEASEARTYLSQLYKVPENLRLLFEESLTDRISREIYDVADSVNILALPPQLIDALFSDDPTVEDQAHTYISQIYPVPENLRLVFLDSLTVIIKDKLNSESMQIQDLADQVDLSIFTRDQLQGLFSIDPTVATQTRNALAETTSGINEYLAAFPQLRLVYADTIINRIKDKLNSDTERLAEAKDLSTFTPDQLQGLFSNDPTVATQARNALADATAGINEYLAAFPHLRLLYADTIINRINNKLNSDTQRLAEAKDLSTFTSDQLQGLFSNDPTVATQTRNALADATAGINEYLAAFSHLRLLYADTIINRLKNQYVEVATGLANRVNITNIDINIISSLFSGDNTLAKQARDALVISAVGQVEAQGIAHLNNPYMKLIFERFLVNKIQNLMQDLEKIVSQIDINTIPQNILAGLFSANIEHQRVSVQTIVTQFRIEPPYDLFFIIAIKNKTAITMDMFNAMGQFSTNILSKFVNQIPAIIENVKVRRRITFPSGILNMGAHINTIQFQDNTGRVYLILKLYNPVPGTALYPTLIHSKDYLKHGLPNNLSYLIDLIFNSASADFLNLRPDIYSILQKYSLLYYTNSASGIINDSRGKKIYSINTGSRGGSNQKNKKMTRYKKLKHKRITMRKKITKHKKMKHNRITKHKKMKHNRITKHKLKQSMRKKTIKKFK